MNWYIAVLKQYAVFTGRARRTEFWMFVLGNIVVNIGVSIVERIVHSGGVLGALYGLAVLVPSIAVGTRRLHDTGRSGWWQLVALVPILGWIVLIYFCALPGDTGPNTFGADPKAAAAPAA